jgi:hypothetical protein
MNNAQFRVRVKVMLVIFCCASLMLLVFYVKVQLYTSNAFDMKETLKDIYGNEEFSSNFVRADKGVIALKAALGDANPQEYRGIKAQLAVLSLLNGEVDQAIDLFEGLLFDDGPGEYHPHWFSNTQILEWLALSFFRKGEIENCQFNHNRESCILPFTESAYHLFREGSSRAIHLYTDIINANPLNYTAKWLYNLAFMTLGEYPHAVPSDHLIVFDRFEEQHPFPLFIDVAAQAGVDMKGLYGGVIADDFNGDGLIDIFSTSALLSDNVALYLRNPHGGFYDATEHFELEGITGGVHAIQADFNNDGHLDILVLRGGWQLEGGKHPNSLLRNNGDGTFTDITQRAGLLDYSPSHTAVWADFDGDGYLDLFVGHETGSYDQVDFPEQHFDVPQHPSKLFKNNGDETFTDISVKAGILLSKWVKGAVFTDYNNDNKPDLYISCYNGSNHLYRNDSKGPGHFSFTDVTAETGVAEPFFSFPVLAADINNDGWEDLVVFGYFSSGNDLAEEYVTLQGARFPTITYINNGDGTFYVRSRENGPQQSILAMGINIGDLDNDGYPDILAGTGAGALEALYPNVMLKNISGQKWADVSSTSRLGHLQKAHGIAFADFDDDGDLDIYMNIGGLYTGDFFWNALYENQGSSQNWLKISLEGTESNRSAIGAKVILRVKSNNEQYTFQRVVQAGSSYGSSPLQLHFGLGQFQIVDEMQIEWPSGKISKIRNIAVNSSFYWKESEAAPTKLPIRKHPIASPYQKTTHQHH